MDAIGCNRASVQQQRRSACTLTFTTMHPPPGRSCHWPHAHITREQASACHAHAHAHAHTHARARAHNNMDPNIRAISNTSHSASHSAGANAGPRPRPRPTTRRPPDGGHPQRSTAQVQAGPPPSPRHVSHSSAAHRNTTATPRKGKRAGRRMFPRQWLNQTRQAATTRSRDHATRKPTHA